MNRTIHESVFFLLALMARWIAPLLQNQRARLCTRLAGDVPRLGRTWVVRFDEPRPAGSQKPQTIDATLRQFGRFVTGKGHIQGQQGDPFEYQGIIKRNVLYGSFRRVDSHVLAGTGTFLLKIGANSKEMSGHCSWYDNYLDDVWTSGYSWKRE